MLGRSVKLFPILFHRAQWRVHRAAMRVSLQGCAYQHVLLEARILVGLESRSDPLHMPPHCPQRPDWFLTDGLVYILECCCPTHTMLLLLFLLFPWAIMECVGPSVVMAIACVCFFMCVKGKRKVVLRKIGSLTKHSTALMTDTHTHTHSLTNPQTSFRTVTPLIS